MIFIMKIAIPLLFSLAAVASGVDLDLANLGELQKDEHPVVPEQLAAVIDNADRVVVKGGPWSDSTKVYESSRRKDLKALSKALVVVKPDQWFHCMCFGGAAICLYKNEELLASITIHHGTSIRWSKWSSDAAIADVDNWLKWLADRNIDGKVQRTRPVLT